MTIPDGWPSEFDPRVAEECIDEQALEEKPDRSLVTQLRWAIAQLEIEKASFAPAQIADMMIHAIPELEQVRLSLETDIANQKWHHVARTIADAAEKSDV